MNMARRKGTPGSSKKNRNDLNAQQPHSWAKGDVKRNISAIVEDKKTITMSVAQEKLRFEMPKQYPLTNNNDQIYLHKKFKKMASIIPANESKLEEPFQSNAAIAVNLTQPSTEHRISNLVGGISERTNQEANSRNIEDKNRLQPFSNDVQNNIKDYAYNFNVNMVKHKTDSIVRLEKTENIEMDATKECGGNGRYVCTYCSLSCAKPSVLEKHIRAHTNERPFPCKPCGFAFKTKSNLYKHSRTRVHKLRTNGIDPINLNNETVWSPEPENETSTSDNYADDLHSPNKRLQDSISPDSLEDRNSSTSCQNSDINESKTIYKPKFHRVYKEEEDKQKKAYPPNVDYLNEHISKIISENEAIIDVLETPLQKKYGKIKQIAENKQLEAETKHYDSRSEAPLNLTKSNESEHNHRKRCYSESFTPADFQKIAQHPLNPERSIIKDLLLKTKALVTGLLPVTSETYDGTEPLFACHLCQISFRNAEHLEIHVAFYCKGKPHLKENGIKYISSKAGEGKSIRPEVIFSRSNSINVTLPENSVTPPPKNLLISSHQNIMKPDNLVIIKPSDHLDVSTPLPSPGPLLGHTRLVDERRDSRRSSESPRNLVECAISSLSPKRKLDTRIDNNYSPKSMDGNLVRNEMYKPLNKIRCVDPVRMDDLSNQSMRTNSSSLQMFGGEVKIVDNSGSTTILRIEPARAQHPTVMVPMNNLTPSQSGESESSNIVRSSLQSGGTIVQNMPAAKEVLNTPHSEPANLKYSITPHIATPNLTVPSLQNNDASHFPFPPLGVITAYNPLTLPPLSKSMSPNGSSKIFHGGKLIPHVPGMPGPNTPATNMGQRVKVQLSHEKTFDFKNNEIINGHIRPKLSNYSAEDSKVLNIRTFSKSNVESKDNTAPSNNRTHIKQITPTIKVINFDDQLRINGLDANACSESPSKEHKGFLRNAKKHLKVDTSSDKSGSKTQEVRHFNFENLISKAEIKNISPAVTSGIKIEVKDTLKENRVLPNVNNFERSETSYFQKNITKSSKDDGKTKFLRPSSLPLKPGTFTPKKHHGITPNANTMPLISPETPRPAKAYGQLYLNGNAYTYLGLKCSTKAYYCTVNRPQPTYVPNQHSLSMYSNWQICSEATPHPLGLTAGEAMALYDSRHRPSDYSVAKIQTERITTHSSQWKQTKDNGGQKSNTGEHKQKDGKANEQPAKGKQLAGGFESNEEYTYVKGRGRGRYVCSECGIRCKKPSMLKKHIRTHTDVRPYTCKHCNFSFKTKGNLTKHMKSKAHYKKCCELGINPTEGTDGEIGDVSQAPGESDEETDSDPGDANEAETESSDTDSSKSRLPEHEAAHCLLSLWGSGAENMAPPGLISARPCTYPYAPTGTDETPTSASLKSDDMNGEHIEPMDLSKSETKLPNISVRREYTILASLASNTAKLPTPSNEWNNGEPMLNAYLTEKALQGSKIKQSQLIVGLGRSRSDDFNITHSSDKGSVLSCTSSSVTVTYSVSRNTSSSIKDMTLATTTSNQVSICASSAIDTLADVAASTAKLSSAEVQKSADVNTSTENAKFVASEYLKMARSKLQENAETVEKNEEDNTPTTVEAKPQNNFDSEKESIKSHAEHDSIASKVVVGAGGVAFKVSSKGGEFQSGAYTPGRLTDDGRAVCNVCNKTFSKQSQLRLHINIHYMERPFRCSACAVSFRTKGHLQKHERSGAHLNKVSMTSTFGAATSANPRPFRCSDCNIAFRIHGHLAKHLRSKMHVMRLECSGKLPFGTFAEIERAGVSLTDIDTTDCANSLVSLQLLAQKLHEKDPTKLEAWDPSTMVPPLLPAGKESSDEEDNVSDNKTEQTFNSDNAVRTFMQNNTSEV